MRLDVFLTPSELSPAVLDGRVVAVIDVLRATTTVAAALFAGAQAVIPFIDTDDAVRTARQYARGEVRLAGERNMRMIPGFDLGNSPLEYTPASVKGQTVLLTTTNGTRALIAAEDADTVFAASYVNFSVTRDRLLQALSSGGSVSIVCSGSEGATSLEDAACAGQFVRELRALVPEAGVNDAGLICNLLASRYGDKIVAMFHDAAHGQNLLAAEFDDDLHACASIDLFPVLAEFRDRAIVRREVPVTPEAT